MCYYSVTLRRSEFRSATEGEDLVIATYDNHAVARALSDGKIVCVASMTKAHIADFQLRSGYDRDIVRSAPHMAKLIGQPVSCVFLDHNGGYACDVFTIDGIKVPLAYLKPGTQFYLGEKKIPIETRLGVDDPSIVLDHKEETPTMGRTIARALGLCSITR